MLNTLSDQFTSIGGPVLAVLLILSVVAMATAIFKILQFVKLGVGQHKLPLRALDLWIEGENRRAYDVAASNIMPLSRVIIQAMNSIGRWPNDKERARHAATQVAMDNLQELTRHVRILDTIVQAAPMLGLLGTVLGMIDAFGELAKAGGAVDPSQLAGGIFVALSTTALGLTIAIPFYIFSSWIESRIDRERAAMESAISVVLLHADGQTFEENGDPVFPDRSPADDPNAQLKQKPKKKS